MGMRIVDTASMQWRQFDDAPGVQYKVLRHHSDRQGITLLLQFAAGASYPAHRHPAGEEYYVLEGSLDEAGVHYGVGSFVYHPPGSSHRPRSADGCTLLIHLPAHIERLAARSDIND
jgi:anti-sigma factor ChrR (cupin superfamily)